VIRYLLALGPLLLGIALALVWQMGRMANPILYLRADTGTAFLLLGALGSLVALGVALADQRRRTAEARAAQRATEAEAESRRRFMQRLDHEVKNPLTAMRAALANVNGDFDPATARSMRNQVDRLARLSADLRKLTDLEMQPLEMDDVDLPELLSELVEAAQDRPDAAKRRFILGLPQAPWPLAPVPGDRDLLFLAFHNLIDNALKFSGENATIEIRAYEDRADVAVEVADTGPGVSAEELPHLGEELYRGSAAVGVEGSGLGLALVRAIISRHGGTVTIRSRPGHGTVVTARLPGAR
jgi:two-component system, OmpR family, sensor kinase